MAADERNSSDPVSPGCGWSKMTILEDEDDRLRYEHNERHLGSEPRHDVLRRTVVLGCPHTGVELLSHLVSGYPATLLISDPVRPLRANTGGDGLEDVRTARRLTWLLARIFRCDLSVVLSLSSWGAVAQYGDKADRLTTARRILSQDSLMIDNIMVTSLTSRLSSMIWWLSQDPQVRTPVKLWLHLISSYELQVRLIHMVRHPRALLAEKLAREGLSNMSDIKLMVAGICGDFREDLSASNNLNSARYLRVKYEDLLETPTNTTLGLLERIDLPRHQNILSLLSQVESIQLDQVSVSAVV